jgi:hypothetical protein
MSFMFFNSDLYRTAALSEIKNFVLVGRLNVGTYKYEYGDMSSR